MNFSLSIHQQTWPFQSLKLLIAYIKLDKYCYCTALK